MSGSGFGDGEGQACAFSFLVWVGDRTGVRGKVSFRTCFTPSAVDLGHVLGVIDGMKRVAWVMVSLNGLFCKGIWGWCRGAGGSCRARGVLGESASFVTRWGSHVQYITGLRGSGSQGKVAIAMRSKMTPVNFLKAGEGSSRYGREGSTGLIRLIYSNNMNVLYSTGDTGCVIYILAFTRSSNRSVVRSRLFVVKMRTCSSVMSVGMR